MGMDTTPTTTRPRLDRASEMRWLRRALVIVAAFSVVAASCGDGDDEPALDSDAAAMPDRDDTAEDDTA